MQSGVEVVLAGDDLGHKTGPLMRPQLVEELFGESYRRVSDLVHRSGKKLVFHSCGRIYEFLDQRSREAAQAVAAASDLTNDLLRANADNLREANAETRRQTERGVFDIEAVSEANKTLIATIEDSLRISEEGRTARAKASAELDALEQQLRKSLAAASAREQALSGST